MTLYNHTFEKFNENFIGSATLSILVQSCFGGAAAMSVLANGTSLIQMIQLAVIVLICMIANTSILAQMKHKFIFNLTLISIVSSIIFIILNHL
ncbi:hypothetical protein [Flavobacterium seoulense]|uniref:Uncharacterized protein n=1 Tax=Flavobacterium seoulense TaxID=1492738 RepID=A0A066WRT5_9FLAO|nr:hypothetical protein [Flavobacterium seoulense]KDN56772.1 hypothetical protein FEM21_02750 [Flavobacterium seoulense]